MGRKSISMRLARAYSDDARLKIALNWAQEWEASTLSNIKRLEMAVSAKDFDQQCIALGRVKEDLLKRFDALPRVIERLNDPEEPKPEIKQLKVQLQEPPQKVAPIDNPNQKSRSMPEGYITIKEWSLRNGRGPKAAQKIMCKNPTWIPSAIKVRNPHGGVDIWAVPEDTLWPTEHNKGGVVSSRDDWDI